jgi:hypothetical protein
MVTINVTRRIGTRPTRYAALCLLALAAVLCRAHEARAQWTTSGTNTTTTNNVGVGTATPGSKLVVTNNTATPAAPQPGTVLHLINADSNKTRLNIDSFGLGGEPSVTFRSARGTAAAPSATQAGDRIGILHGTGFGATQFLVAAKPNITLLATENWTDTAAGSAITFSTVANGNTTPAERLRINSSGNIGIGTTTPGVLNGVNFAPYISMHVQTPGGGAGSIAVDSAHSASGLVINDSSQPLDNRMWSISQGAGSGKLTFSTHTDVGSPVNRVVIDRAGNLGLGTTAPAAKLHVAGDIKIDGNINAKWQDVAEWVPSTQKLSAGTVVILDVGQNNHVTASMKSYDTRVAGVVSAQPGISLGEAGEGKALVATTGRVRVKVDAARGAIRVGDLLVTSDVPGVAMLSQPLDLGGVPIHRPGTIIGKALEPLASGTGEILVLLSLQ